MTIKQQGGIFGRNPTFNEVEAGDLTVRASVPTITIADTDTTGTHILKASNANLDVSADPSGVQAGSGIRFFVDGDEKVKINSTGNLVISNAGNGIDFSATSGTGTSELFDDYEEGTWTPAGFNVGSTGITAGGSASYSGVYTKVGRFVNCRIDIDVDDAGTSASVGDLIYFSSGLPFTPDASLVTGAGNAVIYNSIGSNALGMVQVFLSSNTVYMKVIQTSGTVNYGQTIRGNFSYSVGG